MKIYRSQKGQGTVEYAIITLAVVLIVVAVMLTTNNPLSTVIRNAFTKTATTINSIPTSISPGTNGGGS